jgi:PAS domain S-box-containing protein
MNKTTRVSVLLLVLLGTGFVVLDVLAHRLYPAAPRLDLPHIVLAASVLLISFFVLSRALETRRHGEDMMRRARDEVDHLSSFPRLNPNPVLEVDASGTITYCNQAATTTLLRSGPDSDARAFLPGDLAVILRELEQKNEVSFQREVQVGSETFAETIQVIPAFNTAHIYGYNITRRKQMEMALRESEGRFRLALKNAPVTVAAQDKDLRFIWAYNQRTVRSADVLGKTDTDLFPPDVAARLIALKRRVLETGTEVTEQMWVVSGNSQVFLDLYLEPIRNESGEIAGVGIATVDLTERKRAEDALRKQATILARLNDAVVVMDRDFRVTFWNMGAERIYGYCAEEVVGQAPHILLKPTYLDFDHDEVIRRCMEDGQAKAESIRISKDGRRVWIESSVLLLRDEGGEPSEFISVDRDITSRREAEASLRRVEAELALGAQERAAMKERQRLARELHDSVAQALYGISLAVHTALKTLDSDRDKVLQALKYALSLTDGGLSEMRAMIFELRPESLETEGLVAALTKRTAAVRARHGIVVDLSLCDEPDLPLATKEALYRIALEALQNAIKHARCNRLDVRLSCQSDGWCLEVCDNGVGFDPLAAYPGHLGLLSMRERAASAGGALTIASVPHCGTQIRALVPASVCEVPARPTSGSAQ